MLTWGLLLLGSLAWLGAAHPIDADGEPQGMLRDKRSPIAAPTMILTRGQPTSGGYQYERPARAFNPVGAYATGGSVASGSFYGPPSRKQVCGQCNQLVDEHPDLPQPSSDKNAPEAPEEEPKPVEEPVPQEVPAVEDRIKDPPAPERKPKAEKAPKAPKAPKRRPSAEEEDDDDDDAAPRKGSRNGGSVYKNFFPIMFGGGSSSARDTAGGERGQVGATAIANSFSKGRGAVASSSATAYGSSDAVQKSQAQQSRYRA